MFVFFSPGHGLSGQPVQIPICIWCSSKDNAASNWCCYPDAGKTKRDPQHDPQSWILNLTSSQVCWFWTDGCRPSRKTESELFIPARWHGGVSKPVPHSHGTQRKCCWRHYGGFAEVQKCWLQETLKGNNSITFLRTNILHLKNMA